MRIHPLVGLGQMRRICVRLLIAPILAYQYAISPFIPSVCRFEPSCSGYAKEAIERHGPFKGLRLAVWRLLRCGPWSKGGFDPVPISSPSARSKPVSCSKRPST